MSAYRPVKKRDILIVACILAAMMLAGSLWDYPISLALYDKTNWYGNLLAAYGEYPASLGFVLAGGMLIAARNRERKGRGAFQLIAGGLLVISGALLAAVTPGNYLAGSKALFGAIGVVCAALAVWLAFRLCRGADRAAVIRVACMLFAVILAEMVLINIIKIPWGRARMRLVAADARAYFMPWWDVSGTLKQTMLAAGAAADDLKSFPSGHTANAACLTLLCLLPFVNKKLAGKATLLFYIGVAWGLMVALSRIIMGAHYLTDTAVGFALTLAVSLAARPTFLGRKAAQKVSAGRIAPEA